ncbi:hypothetical protein PJP10_32125, partial [Mycobacterium kansasii]
VDQCYPVNHVIWIPLHLKDYQKDQGIGYFEEMDRSPSPGQLCIRISSEDDTHKVKPADALEG